MDAAATSAKPKREWPRIPPNYISLRDHQELRRKEKEQQERQRLQEEAVAVGRVEEDAAPAPAPKTEGRGWSEKKSWGGGERNRAGKQWAPVAHRAPPPPPTRAEGAAKKADGAIWAPVVAHRDAPPRSEIAAKKVDGVTEVMAVAQRVRPSPQGVEKKMDGAIGALAVARPEAPPPPRGADAAKKSEGEIGGCAIKKGADEGAASAFQAGAKPDSKRKGKHPIVQDDTATVSSPGSSPEEKKKKKGKGKASGDQETAPVTSGAPVEPAEAAGASSSRGLGKPAKHRSRRKGGVGRSTVTAAPGATADAASPPCVVEPQDKGEKKPSEGRRTGAAPSSHSSCWKATQPAPIGNSSDEKSARPASIGNSSKGKGAGPAPIGNSSEGKGAQPSPAPAAELSSNRRNGGALGTAGETKSEGVAAKPPLVEAEATALAVKVVVRSARPPSIGGRRQQHAGGQHGGGVWVPKVVAPATSRHSGSVKKNN